ncbi:RAMP superfamily CRISPR-associated protein [Pyrodictium delaneyi]|uniref:RAMP superfamily CRISPR-associated protein n=1 Tax=Pyrodictium delaneyi TaxID=1273541 RepID=UPI0012E30F10|nr:RAMP superfamily CRISPR-associated protein [Pyrodictium delaneyi]
MAIGYFDRMDPVLASALTPLHPGAGRAPGVVDLPVQRDPYGYPLIPASSIKGALKTQAGQRRNCISGGRVACSSSDCRAVCCIFGPEPGEGDEGASAVSIIDFFPPGYTGSQSRVRLRVRHDSHAPSTRQGYPRSI